MSYLPREYVDITTGSESASRPYAKFRRSAAQALTPINTYIPISWDTVDADNASWRNAATPTRFTAPQAMVVTISAAVGFSAAGSNQQMAIFKNGSNAGFFEQIVGDGRALSVSGVIDLAAGDYIEIHVSTGVLMNVINAQCSIAFVGGTGAAWGNAGCSVYRTTTFTHNSSGNYLTLTWDGEHVDVDGMHSLVTNTERLTATVAGLYYVSASIEWSGTTAGERFCRITKNGTFYVGRSSGTATGANGAVHTPNGLVWLNVGDYVQIEAYQNSGVNQSIGAGAGTIGASVFSAVRIGYNQAGDVLDLVTAPPFVRVGLTGNQLVTPSTWTPINFNNEIADTDNMFLSGTPTVLTCVTPGKYDVFAAATMQAGGTGAARGLRLRRYNSAGVSQEIAAPDLRAPVAGATITELSTSTSFDMAVGDYIVAEVYHDHSSSLNIANGSGTYQATLSASFAGGTGAAWGNAGALMTGTAAVTTNGWVKVPMTSASMLEGWTYDASNHRLVCAMAGTYAVEGGLSWLGTTVAVHMGIAVRVNGNGTTGLTREWDKPSMAVAQVPVDMVSATYDFVVGDYIELWGYSDTNYLSIAGSQRLRVKRIGYNQNDLLDSLMGPMPFARVVATSSQSIPNTAATPITFHSVVSDTDMMVSLATQPTRVTINSTGIYDVDASVTLGANASGVRDVRLNHYNSAGTLQAVYAGDGDTANINQFYYGRVSESIACSAGDYFVINLFQSSGGALSTSVGNGTYYASMSVGYKGTTGVAWGNAGASAISAAGQSLPLNTWTKLTFAADAWNLDGMHSITSNTDRFTPTVPGIYMGSAFVALPGNASAQTRALRTYRMNAAGAQLEQLGYVEETGISTSTWGRSVPIMPVKLEVGEYIVVEAYSSVAVNTVIGPSASVVRVGYQTNPAADGQQVPNGRVVYTTSQTSASLAAGAFSSDLVTPLTITGNGVNPVLIELSGYAPYINAGSAGHFDIFLWDGAIGGTAIGGGQFYATATGISAGAYQIRGYLAPFTGSKTIRVAFKSGLSNQTLSNQAGTTQPTILTAKWMAP